MNRSTRSNIMFSALTASAMVLAACGSSSSDTASCTSTCTASGGTPVTQCYAAATPNPNTALMFAKYGSAFAAVNSNIIAAAVAAPTASVGTSFQTLVSSTPDPTFYDTPTTFTSNLAAFLEYVYSGGTQPYNGRQMGPAHAGLNITGAQYDYFVTQVVVPVLNSFGITATATPSDYAAFAAPLLDPNFKYQVVTCNAND